MCHAEIEKKFGEHGLRLIQEMTVKKYIQETTKGTFVIGANQIFLTPECIKLLTPWSPNENIYFIISAGYFNDCFFFPRRN